MLGLHDCGVCKAHVGGGMGKRSEHSELRGGKKKDKAEGEAKDKQEMKREMSGGCLKWF